MADAFRMFAPLALVIAAAGVVLPWSAQSATPVARVITPKPSITPHHGKPFIPVLGDWEGTENGFPASFDLRYDKALAHHRGDPQYGITQVVALRPAGCPASRFSYRETLVTGRIPAEITRYGLLGLSNFGFAGSFKAASKATLSSRYHNPSCSGTQTWHMRPATRATIDDGRWRLKLRDGETSTFDVQAGGRLATSIRLPQVLTACNGVQGDVDVFIPADGRVRVSQTGVQLTVRFSRKTAIGQLNSPGKGCAHGPFHFTATVG